MKKFLILFFSLILSMVCLAQTKTVTLPSIIPGNSYISYKVTAADTLTTNLDSISYECLVNQHNLYKITVGASFYKRNAADTLIKISLWGKNFATESYTKFYQLNSDNITGTSAAPTQKTVAYGTAIQYRYIRVNLQIAGQKSSGVKVNSLELKCYWQ